MKGNYSAEFTQSVSPDLLNIPQITFGIEPKHQPSPNEYIVIKDDETAINLVKIFYNNHEQQDFKEILVNKNNIFVGLGNRVYFLNIITSKVVEFDLQNDLAESWYFSRFYLVADKLLVASNSQLFLLSFEGSLIWITKELGIDGIAITEIQDGKILGQGEWDPPGGWLDFTVDLNTGMQLA